MIVNESYIGKTKESLELERLIGNLRDKYMSNKDGRLAKLLGVEGFGVIESTKEWHRMQELLEEQFGFYSVDFGMDVDPMPNAYTIPVSFAPSSWIRLHRAIKTGDDFIKYDKSFYFCTIIHITSGLFFHRELTPSEVLAALYHEIGHNFDFALLPINMPAHMTSAILALTSFMRNSDISYKDLIVALPAFFQTGRFVSNKFKDFKRASPSANAFFECLWFLFNIDDWINNVVSRCLMPIFKLFNGFKSAYDLLRAPGRLLSFKLLLGTMAYQKEKFSDSFAALHGYGPDLAKALAKMTRYQDDVGYVDSALASIPLIGHLCGLNQFIFEHIMSVFNGHPDLDVRMKTCALMIEQDLNDPKSKLSPKTKARIKQDLKDINKFIDEYHKMEQKNKHVEHDYAWETRGFMDSLVDKVFGKYGDLRTVLMEKIHGGTKNIHTNIEKIKNNMFWF